MKQLSLPGFPDSDDEPQQKRKRRRRGKDGASRSKTPLASESERELPSTDPGGLFAESSLLKNTVSENTVSENTVSENTVSENAMSESAVSENTASENTMSENTMSENAMSGETPVSEVGPRVEGTSLGPFERKHYPEDQNLEFAGQSPLDLSLLGTSLLEASAGTGKTYAITTLFLRLLLERSLPVREILVVTYTRAATAELRDRIRTRLTQAYQFLEGEGDPEDVSLSALLSPRAAQGLAKEDQRKLLRSIRNFDQAAIYSIHGFCQRVLQDNSFESGSAFDSSFLGEETPLISEICNDYWASELYDADPLLVRYLLRSKKALTLDRIAKVASKAIGNPTAEIVPRRRGDSKCLLRWRRVQTQAKCIWDRDKEPILGLMTDRATLNGNHYRKSSVLGAWASGMERTLAENTVGIAKAFDRFAKFTNSGLARGTKAGASPPTHDFFDLCDELLQIDASLGDLKSEFLCELADFARAEMTARKHALGVQSFDDLLKSVAGALQGGCDSPLARILRGRFPAALIDEFQDTDPVQYGIFRTVYHKASDVSLFLIGDPKQAIYGFRGADIFAYMDARKDAGQKRYSLSTNWRSDPKLVAAVNALFGQAHNAFVYKSIEFHAVSASPESRPRLKVPLQELPGLEIVYMPRNEDGKKISRSLANDLVPKSTAASIAKLLLAEGEIDGKQITPSDIAVLVRKNSQAQRVQLSLREFGVPSVVEGDASVFDTKEALELERFLSAVLDPSDSRLLLSAATTEFLGLSGAKLEFLRHSDTDLERRGGAFRKWNRTWTERGFVQAYREILADLRVAERLLRQVGGERTITNFYHLGELLQRHSTTQKSGPKALCRWLRLMRIDRNARVESVGDTGQIRLESDAQAVKVVTIHKSKGLEYPIVYCPYLWDGTLLSKRDNDAFVYHDPSDNNELRLELGSDEVDQHKQLAAREILAENMRLLYVALTRAKHHCKVTWGPIVGSEASPLGYLLHQPADFDSSSEGLAKVFDTIKQKDESAIQEDLESLVMNSSESIGISLYSDSPTPRYLRQESGLEALSVRQTQRRNYSNSHFSSFTAMLHQGRLSTSAWELDVLSATGRTRSDNESRANSDSGESQQEGIPSLASFAKGARVGIMIHKIFEGLDFDVAKEEVQSGGSLLGRCQAGLEEFGLGVEWAPILATSIYEVLHTPLQSPATGEGFSLSDVSSALRIDEMEFLFPVSGTTHKLASGNLADLLEQDIGGAWSTSYLTNLRSLRFLPLSGFMRGFMDLVFSHDGRWYIADYKSNHLGDSLSDYGHGQLSDEMEKNHYHLQCLLYVVALHRYLGHRLPDYSYSSHMGGVHYLFVRGMAEQHRFGTGVFTTLPSEFLIEKLSDLFRGVAE